jgi:branched-chain amino acid transport system permease protein
MSATRKAAPWLAAAVALAALPHLFASPTAITALSVTGIMVVFALSYNILLGQTGLLSFGHAVYYGLGGYMAAHAMNWLAAARMPIPLPMIPLVGGFGGLVFGLVFGAISTRRAGTVFSMISLGLGELVAAGALALHTFFGGEAGITVNRTKLLAVFGHKFGPQIEVYYLIAGWCFLSMLAMYALTRTPLGRICNAVRENPERAEFIGYDAQRVRLIAFALAAFFAGIAGALATINFEIVNSQSVGAQQSGLVLLMTFFGGAGHFLGPVVGAIAITLLQLTLSDLTNAWMLYFGLLFVLVVMYSPGGVAGWVMQHAPVWRAGQLGRLAPSYLLAGAPGLVAFAGAVLVIELAHRGLADSDGGGPLRIFGVTLDPAEPTSWIGALVLLAGGLALLRLAWTRVTDAWAGLRATGPAATPGPPRPSEASA